MYRLEALIYRAQAFGGANSVIKRRKIRNEKNQPMRIYVLLFQKNIQVVVIGYRAVKCVRCMLLAKGRYSLGVTFTVNLSGHHTYTKRILYIVSYQTVPSCTFLPLIAQSFTFSGLFFFFFFSILSLLGFLFCRYKDFQVARIFISSVRRLKHAWMSFS